MYEQAQLKQDAVFSPTPDIWQGEYEVEVEQSSTELRNPVMKVQKYRELMQDLVAMAPVLFEAGVTLNLKKPLELLFEAMGIDDIDAMFEPQAAQQPGMQSEAGGMGQAPAMGQPNQAGAAPPADLITDQNTGAMPPA
jgi:hypothetical protein